MSIKVFISQPGVGQRLRALLPAFPGPRKIEAQLRVAPKTKNYGIVGRAFDYLLRFELQRRAPHAQTRPWAAESGLELVERGVDALWGADAAHYLPPQWLASQFLRPMLSQAKSAVASYVSSKRQTRSDQEELAIHAIHLAHLEEVYRRNRLYPNFQEVDDQDVQDLLELLAIVPFDALI